MKHRIHGHVTVNEQATRRPELRITGYNVVGNGVKSYKLPIMVCATLPENAFSVDFRMDEISSASITDAESWNYTVDLP